MICECGHKCHRSKNCDDCVNDVCHDCKCDDCKEDEKK